MEQPVYPEMAPAPKKSNRLLIIILAAVGVCCCLVVIAFALFTQLSPNIISWSLGTLCPTQYPDLSAEKCQSWAEDIRTNHNAELIACFSENSPNAGTADQVFKCLENKGLGPEGK